MLRRQRSCLQAAGMLSFEHVHHQANQNDQFKGGGDDLRQDAVMEQVFELCNQVLSKDQETRSRDLSIRTYKVIPLASQAGILEFVGNTMPLQWVTQAHER